MFIMKKNTKNERKVKKERIINRKKERRDKDIHLNVVGVPTTNVSVNKTPQREQENDYHLYKISIDTTKTEKKRQRKPLYTGNADQTKDKRRNSSFVYESSESDSEKQSSIPKSTSGQQYKESMSSHVASVNKRESVEPSSFKSNKTVVHEYKRVSSSKSKKSNGTDEGCFSIPGESKRQVRIVGTMNNVQNDNSNEQQMSNSRKQVEFSELDAVYGTTPEVSSHESGYDFPYKRKSPQVYQVQGVKATETFFQDPVQLEVLSDWNEPNTTPEKIQFSVNKSKLTQSLTLPTVPEDHPMEEQTRKDNILPTDKLLLETEKEHVGSVFEKPTLRTNIHLSSKASRHRQILLESPYTVNTNYEKTRLINRNIRKDPTQIQIIDEPDNNLHIVYSPSTHSVLEKSKWQEQYTKQKQSPGTITRASHHAILKQIQQGKAGIQQEQFISTKSLRLMNNQVLLEDRKPSGQLKGLEGNQSSTYFRSLSDNKAYSLARRDDRQLLESPYAVDNNYSKTRLINQNERKDPAQIIIIDEPDNNLPIVHSLSKHSGLDKSKWQEQYTKQKQSPGAITRTSHHAISKQIRQGQSGIQQEQFISTKTRMQNNQVLLENRKPSEQLKELEGNQSSIYFRSLPDNKAYSLARRDDRQLLESPYAVDTNYSKTRLINKNVRKDPAQILIVEDPTNNLPIQNEQFISTKSLTLQNNQILLKDRKPSEQLKGLEGNQSSTYFRPLPDSKASSLARRDDRQLLESPYAVDINYSKTRLINQNVIRDPAIQIVEDPASNLPILYSPSKHINLDESKWQEQYTKRKKSSEIVTRTSHHAISKQISREEGGIKNEKLISTRKIDVENIPPTYNTSFSKLQDGNSQIEQVTTSRLPGYDTPEYDVKLNYSSVYDNASKISQIVSTSESHRGKVPISQNISIEFPKIKQQSLSLEQQSSGQKREDIVLKYSTYQIQTSKGESTHKSFAGSEKQVAPPQHRTGVSSDNQEPNTTFEKAIGTSDILLSNVIPDSKTNTQDHGSLEEKQASSRFTVLTRSSYDKSEKESKSVIYKTLRSDSKPISVDKEVMTDKIFTNKKISLPKLGLKPSKQFGSKISSRELSKLKLEERDKKSSSYKLQKSAIVSTIPKPSFRGVGSQVSNESHEPGKKNINESKSQFRAVGSLDTSDLTQVSEKYVRDRRESQGETDDYILGNQLTIMPALGKEMPDNLFRINTQTSTATSRKGTSTAVDVKDYNVKSDSPKTNFSDKEQTMDEAASVEISHRTYENYSSAGTFDKNIERREQGSNIGYDERNLGHKMQVNESTYMSYKEEDRGEMTPRLIKSKIISTISNKPASTVPIAEYIVDSAIEETNATQDLSANYYANKVYHTSPSKSSYVAPVDEIFNVVPIERDEQDFNLGNSGGKIHSYVSTKSANKTPVDEYMTVIGTEEYQQELPPSYYGGEISIHSSNEPLRQISGDKTITMANMGAKQKEISHSYYGSKNTSLIEPVSEIPINEIMDVTYMGREEQEIPFSNLGGNNITPSSSKFTSDIPLDERVVLAPMTRGHQTPSQNVSKIMSTTRSKYELQASTQEQTNNLLKGKDQQEMPLYYGSKVYSYSSKAHEISHDKLRPTPTIDTHQEMPLNNNEGNTFPPSYYSKLSSYLGKLGIEPQLETTHVPSNKHDHLSSHVTNSPLKNEKSFCPDEGELRRLHTPVEETIQEGSTVGVELLPYKNTNSLPYNGETTYKTTEPPLLGQTLNRHDVYAFHGNLLGQTPFGYDDYSKGSIDQREGVIGNPSAAYPIDESHQSKNKPPSVHEDEVYNINYQVSEQSSKLTGKSQKPPLRQAENDKTSEITGSSQLVREERAYESQRQKQLEPPVDGKSKHRSRISAPDNSIFPDGTRKEVIYVGRIPNTTYNVFYSPGIDNQIEEDSDDARSLVNIKSSKLISEGPKGILIFVNKKTDSKTPFDDNKKKRISSPDRKKASRSTSTDGKKPSRRPSSSYSKKPSKKELFPEVEMIADGTISKKPIPPKPPSPTMRGANFTGTLNIKSDKFNGTCYFYFDPRLKDFLRNNLDELKLFLGDEDDNKVINKY